MFDFNCPECNAPLDAENDWVGLTVECPRCGKDIVVPPAPAVPTVTVEAVQVAGKEVPAVSAVPAENGSIFQQLVRTLAPLLMPQELKTGYTGLTPFTKVIFAVLLVLFFAVAIFNVLSMHMMGKEANLPHAVLSGLTFLSVCGGYAACKRKDFLVKIAPVLMWTAPVAGLLALMLPDEAAFFAGLASFPGTIMCLLASGYLASDIVREKNFVFDKFNETALFTMLLLSVVDVIEFVYSAGGEVYYVILGTLMAMLIMAGVCKLYCFAAFKTGAVNFSCGSRNSALAVVAAAAVIILIVLTATALQAPSSGRAKMAAPEGSKAATAGKSNAAGTMSKEEQYYYDLGYSRAQNYTDMTDRTALLSNYYRELQNIPVVPEADPGAGRKKDAWIKGWAACMDESQCKAWRGY